MIFSNIHKLPRKFKQIILITADIIFLPLSLMAGFIIVESVGKPTNFLEIWWCLPLSVVLSMPFFIRSGLYRAVVRQTSDTFFLIIIRTVSISIVVTAFVVELLSHTHIPGMVWVIHGLILLIFIVGTRWFIRYFLSTGRIYTKSQIFVAIYGAGKSGIQLLMSLEQSIEFTPVVFIDDTIELQGMEIKGLKVHKPHDLQKLINRMEIQRVFLSIPSTSRHRRQQIIRFLEPFPIHVQDVPSLIDLANGSKHVDEIREIPEEDLLGRDQIAPNQTLLETCITGKSVLVTGAGGSIGSELCRQILKLRPKRLVLVERTEFNLYSINMELEQLKQNHGEDTLEIISVLGSVRHLKRMQTVLKTHEVQTIYHAAAYKHVYIVENNPIEGVQNNIFGTYHMALAAIAEKVETFVLISTDKAVRPTNVMGATKRCAELILQALAASEKDICFSIVRFGNVIDSSGSAIPLFRRQIRRGGPITVTHPDITRFFMTIPEATQLVIQASAMSKCGDVFVLNMGEPVRIMNLVHRMINLSGLTIQDEENPEGDIPIRIIGLKPGEKLYEELLIGDNTSETDHPMIMRVQENYLSLDQITNILERLEIASKNFDYHAILEILKEVVEGYKPDQTEFLSLQEFSS
jgi:UDP-N-acetylglucosamine 4,6-dehydratase